MCTTRKVTFNRASCTSHYCQGFESEREEEANVRSLLVILDEGCALRRRRTVQHSIPDSSLNFWTVSW